MYKYLKLATASALFIGSLATASAGDLLSGVSGVASGLLAAPSVLSTSPGGHPPTSGHPSSTLTVITDNFSKNDILSNNNVLSKNNTNFLNGNNVNILSGNQFLNGNNILNGNCSYGIGNCSDVVLVCNGIGNHCFTTNINGHDKKWWKTHKIVKYYPKPHKPWGSHGPKYPTIVSAGGPGSAADILTCKTTWRNWMETHPNQPRPLYDFCPTFWDLRP